MRHMDKETSLFCVKAVQFVKASHNNHVVDWVREPESRKYSSELFTVRFFHLFKIHLARCLE